MGDHANDLPPGWERMDGNTVQCPECLFRFGAEHTDTDGGGYTCPVCEADAIPSQDGLRGAVEEGWRKLDDGARTGAWVVLRQSEHHDNVIAAQWDGEAATAWRWSALDQSYHEAAFDEYCPLSALHSQPDLRAGKD